MSGRPLSTPKKNGYNQIFAGTSKAMKMNSGAKNEVKVNRNTGESPKIVKSERVGRERL